MEHQERRLTPNGDFCSRPLAKVKPCWRKLNREIKHRVYGKRQAEISRLPKIREIYLVSVYILPASHSYGASTKNREIS